MSAPGAQAFPWLSQNLPVVRHAMTMDPAAVGQMMARPEMPARAAMAYNDDQRRRLVADHGHAGADGRRRARQARKASGGKDRKGNAAHGRLPLDCHTET